jgi:hypothetical protein
MVLCPYCANMRQWISTGFTPSAQRNRTTPCCSSKVQSQRSVHILTLVAATQLKAERKWLNSSTGAVNTAQCASSCLSRLPRNLKIAFTFWFTYIFMHSNTKHISYNESLHLCWNKIFFSPPPGSAVQLGLWPLLDEWSARRRDLYLTTQTHTTDKQCGVTGSGYSTGQDIAEQTSCGNNCYMDAVADGPQPHCSKYRHLWTLHFYAVLGKLITPALTASEWVTTHNH